MESEAKFPLMHNWGKYKYIVESSVSGQVVVLWMNQTGVGVVSICILYMVDYIRGSLFYIR